MGYEPDKFWNSTLRQYAIVVESSHHRRINEHNNRVWLAWHIAAFQQQKRLPKLSTLLIKMPRRQPQSVEELKRAAKMMVATYKRDSN